MRILVYGDSYANFRRFDHGIQEACERKGIPCDVESIAYSGHHTSRLLARWDGSGIQADHVVLVTGINDVVGRRGVRAFRQALTSLIDEIRNVSPSVTLVEIPAFDEDAPVRKFASKCKRSLTALIFDRKGDRIRRYREVQHEMDAHLATTSDFLPRFVASKFKDRIHLTDEQFVLLGEHVGQQVADMLVKTGQYDADAR